ncbi:GNAT family N-acetyltransferase [Streptomyces hokutonensis]|uniref:GNAT family N-acetyltransferase n=1 Tax=Streptomyces hokutonensis TaxID=1306990 RepID=UPI00131A37AD|nr:GNAT family N-acetyltransferase [Streptomyces hokutonensis]
MVIEVREARRSDIREIIRIRQAVTPHLATTERRLSAILESANGKSIRQLVASVGRRVVGEALLGVVATSGGMCAAFGNPHVDPDFENRGVGTALAQRVYGYAIVGHAHELHAWVNDSAHATAFAQSHGYVRRRQAKIQRLELSKFNNLSSGLPLGYEIHRALDVGGMEHAIYSAEAKAIADEPGEFIRQGLSFSDWLVTVWNMSLSELSLSSIVTYGSQVVGASYLECDDRGVCASGSTWTDPDHRNQGIAMAAKESALLRAKGHGYSMAYTSNDGRNAAMRRINHRLGYEHFRDEWRYSLKIEANVGSNV